MQEVKRDLANTTDVSSRVPAPNAMSNSNIAQGVMQAGVITPVLLKAVAGRVRGS